MARDFLGSILRDDLPDPKDAPQLFESVLTRRVSAFLIDCVLMAILMGAATLVAGVLGFFTLFLTWLALPVILAIVFIAYYAGTLGSHRRATPGMMMMDLVVTPTRDTQHDGAMALAHVLVFWISTGLLTPFVLLVALFTPRRQLLHDLVTGTLIVRRSPMVRHWQTYRPASA